MYEKIDVNGPDRHPIYEELTAVADAEGHDGDIRWNFEKFLVGPDGSDHPLQPDGRARTTRRSSPPSRTPCRTDRDGDGSPVDSPPMSKKTKKRKARLRRSKANHGKRPNMGRG